MAISTPYLDALITAGVSATMPVQVFEEIRSALNQIYGDVSGEVVLAGPSGVQVTFADIGTVDYDVFFSVELDPSMVIGQQGEITINRDSSTAFTVKNSGSDDKSVLRYRLYKRNL